jgi:hypothetical protein
MFCLQQTDNNGLVLIPFGKSAGDYYDFQGSLPTSPIQIVM